MSTSPSQQEMKRIFEKSIKLLDSSQSQLRDVRSILRKAVTQLALLNTGKLEHVNEILAAVVDSLGNDIDVDFLDRKMEELTDILGRQDLVDMFEFAGIEQGQLKRIGHSCLITRKFVTA